MLEEFLECCEAPCEFLVREHGFAKLPSPLEHNRYRVRFRKGELGVDIHGEGYVETASCDLVRSGDLLALGLLVPAAQPRSPGPHREELRDD